MKQDAPIAQLLHRLLPRHASLFRFEPLATADGSDAFETETVDGRVVVRGSSPVAQAAGLNWYLKHYARAHVSWCGDRLQLPDPLPEVRPACRVQSPYRYRYYFNYCTFSYSMPWWQWERWEREIDWMALAGINLPLALTGQEAVWQNVYRRMGFSDEEILAFIAGPAFLAWGWMGNLDGWGGPSPQSWIDGQSALQRRILERERAFGMKPVLPAFTGHVPSALPKHFPEASVRQHAVWAKTFPGTYILDPFDPLFTEIGKLFIEEQTRLYGTDHHYSCDTFNENSPHSKDPAYVQEMGKAVYRGMSVADPDAIWVMQNWMFLFNPTDPGFWQMPQIQAVLRSVPEGRMIVLDLNSEYASFWRQTQSYFGQPWVWNVLHNFGGNCGLGGTLPRLASGPAEALSDPGRQRLVGLGMAPEGIAQNPVVYDLAADLMWRSDAPALDAWLRDYARRRYGKDLPAAVEAWEILRRTVYDRPPEVRPPASMLCMAPSLKVYRPIFYSQSDLVRACELLASVAGEVGDSDPYRYDLVDLTRQMLSNHADTLHAELVGAYEAKDAGRLESVAVRFAELATDMDRVLATRREFLLGKWLADAKAWGTNSEERRLFEWNARTQVTLWADRKSMLRDYARKEWSGLIKGYYLKRWERFFGELRRCLKTGRAFDNDPFQQELRAWEEDWTHQAGIFPDEPQGDSVAVARDLLDKYLPILRP